MELKNLKKDIPVKWKVQNFNKDKTKCHCVPYIDARDVEDLFDEVCGMEGWQDKYYKTKETMFCSIGVKIGDEWIWKSGAGVEKESFDDSDDIKLKGEASDAFKLAGVKWGVGRFLYRMKSQWLNCAGKKPTDWNNKVIPPYKLTEFITDFQSKKDGSKIIHEGTKRKLTPVKSKATTDTKTFELRQKDVIDIIKRIEPLASKEFIDWANDRLIKAPSLNVVDWIWEVAYAMELYYMVEIYIESELRNGYKKEIAESTMEQVKNFQNRLRAIASANDVLIG